VEIENTCRIFLTYSWFVLFLICLTEVVQYCPLVRSSAEFSFAWEEGLKSCNSKDKKEMKEIYETGWL